MSKKLIQKSLESKTHQKVKRSDSKVYRIVSGISKGKVMTYGQIGKILNMNPRSIGRILHGNKDPKNIPCHRVVNLRGEVAKKYAFGGSEIQKIKLIRERVEFTNDRVNLKKCLYKRNH